MTPGILDRVGTPATGTVRLETPDGALCWGVVASAGEPDDPWRLGLAHVRLGASRRLREQAQRYLSARTVGGTPLLLQQMVKGSLADALGRQIEAETVLSGAVPGALSQATLRHVHETITETDRELLRLLGASGFRLDGPGVTAHASALLADAYLDRPTVRS
ncbi:hypothetical protein AB0368_06955 [Actinoplanes sp. NPDC051475]|uniref:hypothetical protein n=1 Tax=Actinoplanes sp. NPDC051475 TaxID=3157225 RepID=UPI00344D99B7